MKIDPTAWADDTAGKMRDFYEENRDSWWDRHMPVSLGGNRNMWRMASDNLMLGLLNIAMRERDKRNKIEGLK
jgi:hypothetical protein